MSSRVISIGIQANCSTQEKLVHTADKVEEVVHSPTQGSPRAFRRSTFYGSRYESARFIVTGGKKVPQKSPRLQVPLKLRSARPILTW